MYSAKYICNIKAVKTYRTVTKLTLSMMVICVPAWAQLNCSTDYLLPPISTATGKDLQVEEKHLVFFASAKI